MSFRWKLGALIAVCLALTVLLVSRQSFGRRAPQGKAEQAKAAQAKSQSPKPTSARVARGRYLVEGLMLCFQCHSEVDWKSPGAPVVPGKKGAGAMFTEASVQFPLLAPNITPDPETGAGKWTDEQLARAIRDGIGHDGRRLFPIMPYLNFRVISDEDLASVIAYLRSIPPVRNPLPPTPLPDAAKQMLPPPMPVTGPVEAPDMANPIKRGEYLVRLGDCSTCHTPIDEMGRPMPGLEFGGGRILEGPWGKVASANITPDPSGIPYYNRLLFLQVMRKGRVRTRQLNNIMLWGSYRNLNDQDLGAIYSYLTTLPPVSHRVDNVEKATLCKRCGNRHGYGERNQAP